MAVMVVDWVGLVKDLVVVECMEEAGLEAVRGLEVEVSMVAEIKGLVVVGWGGALEWVAELEQVCTVERRKFTGSCFIYTKCSDVCRSEGVLMETTTVICIYVTASNSVRSIWEVMTVTEKEVEASALSGSFSVGAGANMGQGGLLGGAIPGKNTRISGGIGGYIDMGLGGLGELAEMAVRHTPNGGDGGGLGGLGQGFGGGGVYGGGMVRDGQGFGSGGVMVAEIKGLVVVGWGGALEWVAKLKQVGTVESCKFTGLASATPNAVICALLSGVFSARELTTVNEKEVEASALFGSFGVRAGAIMGQGGLLGGANPRMNTQGGIGENIGIGLGGLVGLAEMAVKGFGGGGVYGGGMVRDGKGFRSGGVYGSGDQGFGGGEMGRSIGMGGRIETGNTGMSNVGIGGHLGFGSGGGDMTVNVEDRSVDDEVVFSATIATYMAKELTAVNEKEVEASALSGSFGVRAGAIMGQGGLLGGANPRMNTQGGIGENIGIGLGGLGQLGGDGG
ncbi:hypothetical protein L1987_32808 [Smallanthus sonchifolius]|uniref:Uncharacterized protein n=1 Tax=Smallanthus sonchifolius TaxID=185202 RepID=A0ACB9HPA9_9ASTR|nr:hypothetical protein L1987_32808 [Smallanthus sonchifolius]